MKNCYAKPCAVPLPLRNLRFRTRWSRGQTETQMSALMYYKCSATWAHKRLGHWVEGFLSLHKAWTKGLAMVQRKGLHRSVAEKFEYLGGVHWWAVNSEQERRTSGSSLVLGLSTFMEGPAIFWEMVLRRNRFDQTCWTWDICACK